MIQKLRNAVVAPTGMGKKLWQDYAFVETGVAGEAKDYALWFFLDNASQDAFEAKRKHPNCSQYYFFGRFPWAI